MLRIFTTFSSFSSVCSLQDRGGHQRDWPEHLQEALRVRRGQQQGGGRGGAGEPQQEGSILYFKCFMQSISLSRLRVSLQAVEQCHGDAMTSLGLASGSGDDGVLPEEVRGV